MKILDETVHGEEGTGSVRVYQPGPGSGVRVSIETIDGNASLWLEPKGFHAVADAFGRASERHHSSPTPMTSQSTLRAMFRMVTSRLARAEAHNERIREHAVRIEDALDQALQDKRLAYEAGFREGFNAGSDAMRQVSNAVLSEVPRALQMEVGREQTLLAAPVVQACRERLDGVEVLARVSDQFPIKGRELVARLASDQSNAYREAKLKLREELTELRERLAKLQQESSFAIGRIAAYSRLVTAVAKFRRAVDVEQDQATTMAEVFAAFDQLRLMPDEAMVVAEGWANLVTATRFWVRTNNSKSRSRGMVDSANRLMLDALRNLAPMVPGLFKEVTDILDTLEPAS